MLVLDRYRKFGLQVISKRKRKKYEINFERELWKTTLFCKGCFHAHTTLWIRKGRSKICIWHSECKMGLSAVLLGLCFSPAPQDIFQLAHKRSFPSQESPLCTRSWGRPWIICKSSGRWKTGCSPDITLLIQCITHLENLLLCGKVLSYHLIIIVSLGVWNGMGGRKGILKSLLIL